MLEGELLSGEARDGDSEEECFEVGLKERVFARGRNGTGQRHAQREGRTREWLGKETGDKASRISAVCQGHSGIKLVENGLKATRRGLRRKPCPEP